MRIAHLSTSQSGGAGIAAKRSSDALKSIGIENDFFALKAGGLSHNTDVQTILRTRSEVFRSRSLTVLQKHLIQRGDDLLTPISLEPRAVRDIFQEYDLLHIHSTYNILRHNGFKELLQSGKSVVITLHDQRWFTGGCHYSGECEKYKIDCKECPQATDLGKRFVSQTFQNYLSILSSNPNLKVISPSSWLARKALESRIFSDVNLRVIRNPIPTTALDFSHRDLSRENYQRNQIRIIAFVAENLQNPLKGLNVVLNAFDLMHQAQREKFQLLLIGNNPPNLNNISVSTRHVVIEDSESLISHLSVSDLLVVPSFQDNLPNVIGEAYSSGIKILGSDVGGIPEVVSTVTGDLFQCGNHHALSRKLLDFDFDYSRDEVISFFESNFSYKNVGEKISNFYME